MFTQLHFTRIADPALLLIVVDILSRLEIVFRFMVNFSGRDICFIWLQTYITILFPGSLVRTIKLGAMQVVDM